MGATVTYNGSVVAELNGGETKKLLTGGKYLEGDLTVEAGGGGGECDHEVYDFANDEYAYFQVCLNLKVDRPTEEQLAQFVDGNIVYQANDVEYILGNVRIEYAALFSDYGVTDSILHLKTLNDKSSVSPYYPVTADLYYLWEESIAQVKPLLEQMGADVSNIVNEGWYEATDEGMSFVAINEDNFKNYQFFSLYRAVQPYGDYFDTLFNIYSDGYTLERLSEVKRTGEIYNCFTLQTQDKLCEKDMIIVSEDTGMVLLCDEEGSYFDRTRVGAKRIGRVRVDIVSETDLSRRSIDVLQKIVTKGGTFADYPRSINGTDHIEFWTSYDSTYGIAVNCEDALGTLAIKSVSTNATIVTQEESKIFVSGLPTDTQITIVIDDGEVGGGGESDDTIVNVGSLPESVDNTKIYCFETEVVKEAIIVTDGAAEVNTDYAIVVVDELPETDNSTGSVFVIKDSGIGYIYYYGWRTVGQLIGVLGGVTLEDKGYITDEELAEGGLADGVYFHKEFIKNYGIPNTDEQLCRSVYVNEGNGWDKVNINYIRMLIDSDYPANFDEDFALPSDLTRLRPYAFYQTRIYNVIIPNSVTVIGASAFGNSSISEIDIPESVTRIGSKAFATCYNLGSVTLPSGKIEIGYRAFYDSAIYNNTDKWENNIFYIGNHLLDTNNKCTGDVIVKDGTKTIQELAFENTTGVTSVTFPDSVVYLNYGSLAVPNCFKFIFKSKTPPELATNAIFDYSNAEFYVPSDSVDAYKTADDWKSMADKIFPIEE